MAVPAGRRRNPSRQRGLAADSANIGQFAGAKRAPLIAWPGPVNVRLGCYGRTPLQTARIACGRGCGWPGRPERGNGVGSRLPDRVEPVGDTAHVLLRRRLPLRQTARASTHGISRRARFRQRRRWAARARSGEDSIDSCRSLNGSVKAGRHDFDCRRVLARASLAPDSHFTAHLPPSVMTRATRARLASR